MACKKKYYITSANIYIHVYIFRIFICYQISIVYYNPQQVPLANCLFIWGFKCIFHREWNEWLTYDAYSDHWNQIMNYSITENKSWCNLLQRVSSGGRHTCWPVNRPWWDTGPAVEGMDSRVWTPDFHWWTGWLHIMDFFIRKVRV